jgi:hypothetical protein
MKEIKTGLERNKKYIVDYTVKGDGYSTIIYTTSQKRAKEMLQKMFPDACKIVAKHWAEY